MDRTAANRVKLKPASRISIEALAKVAYEYHYTAMSGGTEVWRWEDIPIETRRHWIGLIGTVMDYRTENRRMSKCAES